MEGTMDRVLDRCAGLDVHQKTVVVCIRVPGERGRRQHEVRTFGATTADLLALRDWLVAHEGTHVALESTGVYWKPIDYALEEAMTCVLVNAAPLHHVPGRKTAMQDCVWLAQVLEHGVIRGSFVPPAPMRDLRDLTRYRKTVIQERARVANRLQKMLEDAGLKLASVASDVLGVSGRAMLQALVAGTTDPATLADLARGPLRRKLPALRAALTGHFRAHHALLVGRLLADLDYCEEAIADVSTRIEELMRPFASQLARLDTIPGINRRTAEVVIAEMGTDMTVFPTARHAASWTGLAPGQHESAGKRRAVKTRPGNRWLRTALVEAALAATHKRDSALRARYQRLARHRGHQTAIVALARTLVTTAYYVLARDTTYHELGAAYFDQRHQEQVKRRALRTLQRLGYTVSLETAA
jgi:transposase